MPESGLDCFMCAEFGQEGSHRVEYVSGHLPSVFETKNWIGDPRSRIYDKYWRRWDHNLFGDERDHLAKARIWP